eukprot:6492539-Amphidinium_carterae.2
MALVIGLGKPAIPIAIRSEDLQLFLLEPPSAKASRGSQTHDAQDYEPDQRGEGAQSAATDKTAPVPIYNESVWQEQLFENAECQPSSGLAAFP